MYKAVALTSIAALAGQSMALNAHRHEHNKRAVETTWCTVWDTVYVTVNPGESTPAASATDVAIKAIASSAAGHPAGAGAGPTVTSTSTIVVASSKPVAAASSPQAPAAKPTTLSTAVRASSAAAAPVSSSAPAVSAAAVPQSSQPAAPSSSSSPAPQPSSQKASPTPSPSSSAPPPPPPSSTSSKAAPSATPSKAASPPPSTGGTFSFKRGMAYNDAGMANTFGGVSNKVGWAYNWGFWPGSIDSQYKYIPMLWSNATDHTSGFDAQVETLLASGSPAIFSINEPDIISQAAMSVAAAAEAHAFWLNKYAGRALIGAPAVSNSGSANQGLDYLSQWVQYCDALSGGCSYDFCNIHWYSPASAIDDFFNQINKASQVCGGKPVMITEFAPSGSDAEIQAFLEQALPKLDSMSNVMGYSYFMVGTGSLMNTPTSLSDYGNTYATA